MDPAASEQLERRQRFDRHRDAVRARLLRSDHLRAGPSSVSWKINREIVVVAVPVAVMPTVFKAIAPHLQPGALVVDVGSVKMLPAQWMTELLPDYVEIVATHPLFGPQSVARDGLPGEWPSGYDDAETPYTPAWQEEITGVPAEQCLRIAREFATNAEDSSGRSMIIMGAGICQWFHGDATYRAILSLLVLTGSMGRNGGGWAHYVGQEKCRPITGWISLANALDWSRPPRTMIGTAYWYMHTGQAASAGSADAERGVADVT